MVRELLENEQEDDEEDDEDATNNDGGTPLVGQYVPGCSEEGYFNSVQIWENNKWCVNVVTGAPISDAYTLSDGLPFSCPSKYSCMHTHIQKHRKPLLRIYFLILRLNSVFL